MSDKITINKSDKSINLDDLKKKFGDTVENISDGVSGAVNKVEEVDLGEFFTNVKDKVADGTESLGASFSNAVSNIKDKFSASATSTDTTGVNNGSNCYIADKFSEYTSEHPDYSEQVVLNTVLFKVGTEMGIVNSDNYSTNNYTSINKVEKTYDSVDLNELETEMSKHGSYQTSYNTNNKIEGTSNTYKDVKISYDTGREYTDPATGNKISLTIEQDGSYTMSITDNGTTKTYENAEKLTTADLQNIYEGLSTYNPNRSFY